LFRSPADAASRLPPCSKYKSGFKRQLYVLSGRQLCHLVRHPLLFSFTYGAVLVAALVLGLVFWNTG
jgi:hypothetical protein